MRLTTSGVLACAAILLAVLAPIAGAGEGNRRDAPGVAELSRELADGAPLVDAVTLGEWIRDRRPLRVWDLRDEGEHVRFSIPTAEHVPFGRVAGQAPDSSRTLVLYDDGDGRAVRAWLLLRRLGHPDVRILERGVLGWIDGILNLTMPAGTPAERERYERAAAVSRYFGGMPRVGRPAASAVDADEAVRLLSRRGCY